MGGREQKVEVGGSGHVVYWGATVCTSFLRFYTPPLIPDGEGVRGMESRSLPSLCPGEAWVLRKRGVGAATISGGIREVVLGDVASGTRAGLCSSSEWTLVRVA